MALINRKSTECSKESNRRNAQNSTGPRTERGKHNSSRNSRKHSILAFLSRSAMESLGEDPAELEALHKSLREDIKPQGEFEENLTKDLAEIRWRVLRTHRAELALLMRARESYEETCVWNAAMRGKDSDASSDPLERVLLKKMMDTPSYFAAVLEKLKDVRTELESDTFSREGLDELGEIYGALDIFEGNFISDEYAIGLACKDQADRAETAKIVRPELDREIAGFKKLLEIATRRSSLDEAAKHKDAELILSDCDMARIVRYEAHLERQVERKLNQLYALRREKRKESDNS